MNYFRFFKLANDKQELSSEFFVFLCFSLFVSATTRRLYERRLQNLLDKFPLKTTPPEPETAVPETVTVKADGSQNGNTHTTQDEYSDKEEGSDFLGCYICCSK